MWPQKPQLWEQDWVVRFYPGFIRISTTQKLSITQYYFHEKELTVTTEAKYLGFTILNNLSLNHHAHQQRVLEGWNLSICSIMVKLKLKRFLMKNIKYLQNNISSLTSSSKSVLNQLLIVNFYIQLIWSPKTEYLWWGKFRICSHSLNIEKWQTQ